MRVLIAVLTILGAVCVCEGRTITVDDDGAADFSTIQAAIDDSFHGDTVLVGDGTYTGDGNRDIDLHGKVITVRSENGPETCIIDCNGTEANPHRGFYFHSGEGRYSAVIGFTITHGHPPREECVPMPPFPCSYLGGGIRCKESSPTISQCTIMGNRAEKGGGVYLEGGAPIVRQCTITGNYAWDSGGGINIDASDAEISNCIIWDNVAPSHGQIYIGGSGSGGVAYSDVQGGWSGVGNIEGDPCFAEAGYWDPSGTPQDANDDFWVDGDYYLKSQAGRWNADEGEWTMDEVTSPCIDAGDPMSPIGPEPFPSGGIVNMGAYGGTAEASKSYFGGPPCETIVSGDVNGDCNVNFLDFRIMALRWLEDNRPGSAPPGSYLFVPDPSALVASGGFTGDGQGIRSIEGWFELTVNSAAGTAEFSRVDASLSDGVAFLDLSGGGFVFTDDLNRLFSMTELVSTDVNDTAIDFVLERGGEPYTDIHLRATFIENSVHLVGNFSDPCCDMYSFYLDAIAVRQ